jgi:predicted Rossmann fold flavoprotein
MFGPRDTISFFEGLGLLCKEEYGGRVFPYCGQAAAVLDVLRNAGANYGVKILTGVHVKDLNKRGGTFEVRAQTAEGARGWQAGAVIAAAGGLAAPFQGADGGGMELLKRLGHEIVKPVPALSQLRTDARLTKGLRGLKVWGRIWSEAGGGLCEATGEILFTDYGLSGTAVLDFSRILSLIEGGWEIAGGNPPVRREGYISAAIDFMPEPEYSEERLIAMLGARKGILGRLTMEDFFTGLLSKKLGQMLTKAAGVEKLSLPAAELSHKQIRDIARLIKKFEIRVLGDNGWNNAQVMAGGALTAEFDGKRMESRLVKGLFAAGELLDIFGECGGFNLQWAWASGRLAGRSAAESLRKSLCAGC